MYFRTLWRDERLKSTFDFLVADNSSNYYIDAQESKRELPSRHHERPLSNTSSEDDSDNKRELDSDLQKKKGEGMVVKIIHLANEHFPLELLQKAENS